MIKRPEVYKNFPLRIVLYRAPLLVMTLVVGGIVSAELGKIGLIFFLLYTISAVLWTMKHACRNCAYHGKRCDLGVSLVASIIHREKGNTKLFHDNVVIALWLLLIMLIIPLFLGIARMIISFDYIILYWIIGYVLMVAAVILTTILSCPHCAMRAVCPLSFYKH